MLLQVSGLRLGRSYWGGAGAFAVDGLAAVLVDIGSGGLAGSVGHSVRVGWSMAAIGEPGCPRTGGLGLILGRTLTARWRALLLPGC